MLFKKTKEATSVVSIFVLLLIFLVTVSLIASATGWTAKQPFHEPLFTDTIQGKSGELVTVQDKLTVTGAIQSNAYPGLLLTHADGQIRFYGEAGDKWAMGSTGALGDDFILHDNAVGVGGTTRMRVSATNGDVTFENGRVCIGPRSRGETLSVVNSGNDVISGDE